MADSLNDDFTLDALAHIETRRPNIPIFHILASVGQMVSIDFLVKNGHAGAWSRTALINWLADNPDGLPKTWRDLVSVFRSIQADEVANGIEELFVSAEFVNYYCNYVFTK